MDDSPGNLGNRRMLFDSQPIFDCLGAVMNPLSWVCYVFFCYFINAKNRGIQI
jgi:hypothetical protein